MTALPRRDADILVTINPYAPRTVAIPRPWGPLDFPELGAWWDCSQTDSITSLANRVSALADLGHFDLDMPQPVGAFQPYTGIATMNGRNVLSFAGHRLDNYARAADIFPPYVDTSFFYVFRQTGLDALSNLEIALYSSNQTQFPAVSPQYDGFGEEGADVLQMTAGPNFALNDGPWSYGTTGLSATTDAKFNLTRFRRNLPANDSELWENGVIKDTFLSVPGMNYAPTFFAIGGHYGSTRLGRLLTGELGEVIVVRNLTTADRLRAEGYLAWKWGLVANLPTGHLYKKAPPTVVDG
jgi:hypothetical protein